MWLFSANSSYPQQFKQLRLAQRQAVQRRTEVLRAPHYRQNPVGYCRDVLKVELWDKQCEIASKLLTPPYRVLVRASHSVGKSFLAAALVNWWFDTRYPGVCLTTAPTARQVRDVLWKEVRRQRRAIPGGLEDFVGPKIPRLETAPFHWAYGFTAQDAVSFQGQHEAAVLIIFDEAVGIDGEFWEAAESMLQGQEYAFLAIYNPTDTTSRAYLEEQTGHWHIVTISALEHPNIAAELEGRTPPYPSAIRLQWLLERLEQWAEKIEKPTQAGDLEFPPGSGQYWRPGPLAEARLLARWPASGCGVWSEPLWELTCQDLPLEDGAELVIGCDVARYGDDDTAIHVRYGNVSLHHESHQGWSTQQTAQRLKELAQEWCAFLNGQYRQRLRPHQVRIQIDDDGVGGGVVDSAQGFNFIGIRAGAKAIEPHRYPNRRSELWFAFADRVREGRVSFARLPQAIRDELRRQALSAQYHLDSAGRRVVEPKDDIKKRLGRSPDDIDAVHLAYCDVAVPGLELIHART